MENKIIKTLPQNKVNGTLFFIPHLGLGDQFVNNGLVNICLEKFSNVVLVIKKNQLETIKHMYNYTNKIVFYTILHDREISPNYGLNIDKFINMVKNSEYYFYLQCSHSLYDTSILGNCFSKSFYLELGLDPLLRYSKFRTYRNHERENEYYNKFIGIYGTEYLIIHQDKERKLFLDENKINNITKYANLPRYSIGNSDSDSDSDNFKSDNLFDYCLIFEKCKEFHIMPSSISILCDQLNVLAPIYIHYYTREKEWLNQDIKQLYTNKNIEIVY